MTNRFEHFFYNINKKLTINKWHHYFEIYDTHFKKFLNKNPVIVEIGVQNGGSLEMWNYYFEGKCKIYGLDINPKCKKLEANFNNVTILIGDQSNDEFLDSVQKLIPQIDILIDDGSHINSHQIKSFEKLYQNIAPDGVYLVEDLHTSYWSEFGGKLNNPDTFIEYSKKLIDNVNAFHIPNYDRTFAKTTNALHYYDSVLVIEKKIKHTDPIQSRRGPGK